MNLPEANDFDELPSLLSLAELEQRLSGTPDTAGYRAALKWAREEIYKAFSDGTPAHDLVKAFTAINDRVIRGAWQHFLEDAGQDLALLAVGGYGRGELLPFSDIDLLILYAPDRLDEHASALEAFIAFCWDCGLEVGHSVRSVVECESEAGADLTIVTNLMESRRLCGDPELAEAMSEAVSPLRIWPADAFFRGKFTEQKKRHHKYDDSGYKLEPNVKEGPGGLRDIQMISWMSQRLYGSGDMQDFTEHGLLSDQEAATLFAGRDFLWRVRFALHMIAGRSEDRLLFDHQVRVAELFGYEDGSHNLAVEQFMQLYYRTIKGLSVLNDILLQLFNERIFHGTSDSSPQSLSPEFQLDRDFIQVKNPEVFRERPLALMEIFVLWADNEALGVKGIGADTLRIMRRDRNLIDSEFCASVEARQTFIEILRKPRGVLHTLRRMNRYGILGRYIPAFGKVIGRMQYDLFHTLTVDEHTLFVVRNIRRLAVPEFRHEFPEFSELARSLAKPELLTLAGLFHDIAKGRGGDHSELGGEDAYAFCHQHGLATADCELVAWLVRNHLLMSLTAQRKDVSDPQVVNEFASLVGSTPALDFLYLLTVCDIRATNAKLWNGFKAGLLRSLYSSARRVLERGNPVEEAELIAETRHQARSQLAESGLPNDQIDAVWARMDDEYFLKHSATEVAWQTQAIANTGEGAAATVLVRQFEGRGTAVFLYLPDARHLFAATTAALSQLGVNVLDARISNTTDGYTLDTFFISEPDGSEVNGPERRAEIRARLVQALASPDSKDWTVTRRVSTRRKHFSTPTQIYFSNAPDASYTIMELVAGDRPGLLSAVGRVFADLSIDLRDAKIGTIGERAEDLFFITAANGKAITDGALLHQLREAVTSALSGTT